MCGIAGYVGQGSERDLERMIGAIAHRGPDDTGVYATTGLGLAHARLSIIDLSPAGHEPMWNHDRTVAMVLNGEIYNFQDLRAREVPQYRYRGHSDAEVILAMYEKYGTACFEQFNGMFAIALWDTHSRILLLARDRMGKKPLYWGRFGESLVFASEPKAILAHPSVRKEVNLSALRSYLALDYVPTPLSIWKGIEKLGAGEFLSYTNGSVETARYWHPSYDELHLNETSALGALDAHLKRAVELRLLADVPLGVFLSGGLDSSTVAYYASRASASPLHTFSIGFAEKSFDESPYASRVAKHLGTVHHHKTFQSKDAISAISPMFALLDEPLADASLLPTYLLSQFAREQVTVALGGDGADELFAGYPTFQAEKGAGIYRAIPQALRDAIIDPCIEHLPSSERYMGITFQLQKFIEGAGESNITRRHMRWLGTFGEEERNALVMPDVWHSLQNDNVYASAESAYQESGARDEHNKLLFAYERSYLMDQVLVKVDRASMQNALEVRAPFLDYELVEFANRLPYHFKLNGFMTKYLLKQLMREKLPVDIIDRRKQGFAVPMAQWLRGPLREWGAELLSTKSIRRHGLLNEAHVQMLWQEHQSGRRNNAKKLWNLLALTLWQRTFL